MTGIRVDWYTGMWCDWYTGILLSLFFLLLLYLCHNSLLFIYLGHGFNLFITCVTFYFCLYLSHFDTLILFITFVTTAALFI